MWPLGGQPGLIPRDDVISTIPTGALRTSLGWRVHEGTALLGSQLVVMPQARALAKHPRRVPVRNDFCIPPATGV